GAPSSLGDGVRGDALGRTLHRGPRREDRATRASGGVGLKSIPGEEESEVARGVCSTRRGHREEDDRRLLTLKLVDSANANPVRERLTKTPDLLVVGRDDHEVLRAELPSNPARIDMHAGEHPIDFFSDGACAGRAVAVHLYAMAPTRPTGGRRRATPRAPRA